MHPTADTIVLKFMLSLGAGADEMSVRPIDDDEVQRR
jgi:hypothetical protein